MTPGRAAATVPGMLFPSDNWSGVHPKIMEAIVRANDGQVPAYGYTYELRGYPQVEPPYAERKNDSWVYPTKAERRTYRTGAEGGFLIQNAGAPAA